MGGRISFPLNSYHATKFALEGLSESIQYSKASFDILEYLKKIQAVDSKGRTVKYQLLKEGQQRQQHNQLTLDEIFEEVSKVKITTY